MSLLSLSLLLFYSLFNFLFEQVSLYYYIGLFVNFHDLQKIMSLLHTFVSLTDFSSFLPCSHCFRPYTSSWVPLVSFIPFDSFENSWLSLSIIVILYALVPPEWPFGVPWNDWRRKDKEITLRTWASFLFFKFSIRERGKLRNEISKICWNLYWLLIGIICDAL